MAIVIDEPTADGFYAALRHLPDDEVERLKAMLNGEIPPGKNRGVWNDHYIVFLVATIQDVINGFLKLGYMITTTQALNFSHWFDYNYSNAYVDSMRSATTENFNEIEFICRAEEFAEKQELGKIETASSQELAHYFNSNIEMLRETENEDLSFIGGLTVDKINEVSGLPHGEEACEVVAWLRSIVE